MRSFVAALCLLPAIVSAGTAADDGGNSGAVEVFHCAFDQSWDVNYDAWPDRWERRTGPNYPHYAITEIRNVDDTRALVIQPDGAAAAVTSTPIRVLPRFSYVLKNSLK